MKGKIKFLDAKTRRWGFIVPDDPAEADVHFQVEDFVAEQPTLDDPGRTVEFELEVIGQSRKAKTVQLGSPVVPATSATAPTVVPPRPGDALKRWAYVPFVPFTHRDRTEYSSVLEYLAQIALPERYLVTG